MIYYGYSIFSRNMKSVESCKTLRKQFNYEKKNKGELLELKNTLYYQGSLSSMPSLSLTSSNCLHFVLMLLLSSCCSLSSSGKTSSVLNTNLKSEYNSSKYYSPKCHLNSMSFRNCKSICLRNALLLSIP